MHPELIQRHVEVEVLVIRLREPAAQLDDCGHATKLRVQARALTELCGAVASGLDIDEPVALTLFAASLSDAAPLSDLAELPDKSKVSVWPARCFGGASTLEDSDDDDAVAGCDKSWTQRKPNSLS